MSKRSVLPPDWHTGDKVRLRSGGPWMTLGKASESHLGITVEVVWFDDGNQLRKESFFPVMLVRQT
ncbi:hypothetical protein Rpal_3978 [Rhodopseudomonas palustris TIE-1]|uniref:DUF2158 domain-containing protein n=1 Tax=Rhodopseudomonas palustris TaxID=1076 RepID=UPI000177973E|nr:hypothetical protein Rpal_3978 [Rhodopseudomonas palustris TIE-1]